MVVKPKFFVFVFLFFVFVVVSVKVIIPQKEKVRYETIVKVKTINKIVKIKSDSKDFISPEKVFAWYPYLKEQCKKRDVDVKLMMAIYKGESGFDPKLVNPNSGCTGLGQIEYRTYKWLHKDFFPDDGTTFSDMKNPQQNIKYTVLRYSLAIKESKKAFEKSLHIYGGCVSKEKKFTYVRYIKRNYKELYGSDRSENSF